MRKIIWCSVITGIVVLVSCQLETAHPRSLATQSGWKAFGVVEDDLEQIVELFENSLRLDQMGLERDSSDRPGYFNKETLINKQGWWKVMDGNGCRFRVLPDNKSLTTKGALWIARAKYYSNDSVRIECIGQNQWILNGFCKGNQGWRTEASLKISCRDTFSGGNLDSVSFLVEGNGVLHLVEMYPAKNIEITFSIPRPLLRKDRSVYRPYTFMEGRMNIHMEDFNKKRKESAVVEIEDLPLEERMVRVISRGITEVYS